MDRPILGILNSGSISASGIKTNFLNWKKGWGIVNSEVSRIEFPKNKIFSSSTLLEIFLKNG